MIDNILSLGEIKLLELITMVASIFSTHYFTYASTHFFKEIFKEMKHSTFLIFPNLILLNLVILILNFVTMNPVWHTAYSRYEVSCVYSRIRILYFVFCNKFRSVQYNNATLMTAREDILYDLCVYNFAFSRQCYVCL